MTVDKDPTNARVNDCLRSSDPLACLAALFDETADGYVAFKAAGEAEKRGDLPAALRWFELADAMRSPTWNARAAQGANRVRQLIAGRRATGGDSSRGPVLVIVGCTRQKIWHDDPSAPEFVPARFAYTGPSLPSWVRAGADAPDEAPWLFLSAKYGFIEPDHPIGDYDVTFSDPSTGPITFDALRQQAEHQTRFGRQRLRDISAVQVLAGARYREAVQYAFARLGADVSGEIGPPGVLSGGGPPAGADPFSVVPDRARAVGQALAELSPATLDAIDQGEPEWNVLSTLRELSDEIRTLTAILLGLCDYQLGPGGANVYWQDVRRELEVDRPSNVASVRGLMTRILGHPVSEQGREQKVARVDRLLASDLPASLAARGLEGTGEDLATCWRKLAAVMRSPLEAKTIVFAVKLVDLMYFQETGRRAALPDAMPIAVDIRIARASVSSGILRSNLGRPADDLVGLARDELLGARDPYVEAWSLVAAQTEYSPLRLDSVIWQAAGHVRPGVLKERARSSIAGLLVGYGTPPDAARRVADELTAALGGQTAPVP